MKRLNHLISRCVGLTVGTLFFAALPLAQAYAAGAPNVYFAQSNVTAPQNSNISLPIRVNANGTGINAVNVVATFPTDKLTLVSVDKTGAYFDTSIPASPTAINGTLEFSVAKLGAAPITNDVLVSTLVFQAKANSGSAAVSLSGSAAANNGTAVPITTTDSTVAFTDQSTTPTTSFTISDIHVTDTTTGGGIVRWHTDVPTSSSVDYGSTTGYGSNASASGLTADHAVTIPNIFSPKTTVHLRVTSVAADSTSQTSGDQTFITLGYNVQVTVNDTSGKPISGAKVSVAGGIAVKTNKQGVAVVPDVGPGVQKFVVDDQKPQLVMVNPPQDKNDQPQGVTLVGNRRLNIALAAGISSVVVIVAIAAFIIIHRQQRPPWLQGPHPA